MEPEYPDFHVNNPKIDMEAARNVLSGRTISPSVRGKTITPSKRNDTESDNNNNTAIALLSHQMGTTVSISNTNCPSCSKPLQENCTKVTRFPCGHGYHFSCVGSGMKNQGYCLACPTKGKKMDVEDDNWDAGIPASAFSGKDPKAIEKLERMYGKQGVESKLSNQSDMSQITYEEKRDLVKNAKGFLASLQVKVIKATVLNKEYLKKEGISISNVFGAKISIGKVYAAMEIKSWQDLLDVGICMEDLYNYDMVPISTLASLYKVDLSTLHRDLGMEMYDVTDMLLTPQDLRNLRTNMKTLIYMGITLDYILHMQDYMKYTVDDWISFSMSTDDLTKLGITKTHLNILGWPSKKLSNAMGMAPSVFDSKTLGQNDFGLGNDLVRNAQHILYGASAPPQDNDSSFRRVDTRVLGSGRSGRRDNNISMFKTTQ